MVREAAAELSLDGETTWELMLATTEAVANAVEHGAPCGPAGIMVRIAAEGAAVEVEVCDCGCFVPPRHAPSMNGDGTRGRGMPIIAAVMDRVEVLPASGTTRVRFEKRLLAA